MVKKAFAFLFLVYFLFYHKFFLGGLLPIPADTIAGLYHPYRDSVYLENGNYPPYKNFLITDPVRQQYVWRKLCMDSFKQGLGINWNPYSFAGYPFLGNLQSACFYPLNLFFLVLPFETAWALTVSLATLFLLFFMFILLRSFNLGISASIFASISFAFCGFVTSWIWWNTVIHSALYLPLILFVFNRSDLFLNTAINKKKQLIKYFPRFMKFAGGIILIGLIYFFSLSAGHIQTYSYVVFASLLYLVFLSLKNKNTKLFYFGIGGFTLSLLPSYFILKPFIRFYLESARNIDQANFLKEGFFIPFSQLIQFLVPDFFGNPATLNYWGVFNYGEFSGFIGATAFIFSIFFLVFVKSWIKKYILILLGVFLVLATPNPISFAFYRAGIPFLSSSQPTRLIFLACFVFSLSSAFGFDAYLKGSTKGIFKVTSFLILSVIFLILAALFLKTNNPLKAADFQVSMRNSIVPLVFLSAGALLLFAGQKIKNTRVLAVFFPVLIVLEMFRFSWKFLPFTNSESLYNRGEVISYLEKESGLSRVMVLDGKLMPPNFSVYHKLYDVAGYDPLYLKLWAQFASVWIRDSADIRLSSFNRIITPQNWQSPFTDFIGVKHILSLGPMENAKLEYILNEKDTYLYENNKAFPRAYFIQNLIQAADQEDEARLLYEKRYELDKTAVSADVTENYIYTRSADDEVLIKLYHNDKIILETVTRENSFLILTDVYYPSWKAEIDGQPAKIYRVNLTFRGIEVPAGRHIIIFNFDVL